MSNYLGIDIGGTNVCYGIVNEAGEFLHQNSIKTNTCRSAEELADKIFNALKKEYKEDECIICSESLFENFDKIFDCKQCKKFIHSICAQAWYTKQIIEEKKLNKQIIKGCALCRKEFNYQFIL